MVPIGQDTHKAIGQLVEIETRNGRELAADVIYNHTLQSNFFFLLFFFNFRIKRAIEREDTFKSTQTILQEGRRGGKENGTITRITAF